jgi:DNA helicase II / ATP-dependent DNA helicase PcrA
VRLEENYRSTPQILDLANAVIAGNTERRGKTLRATRPSGETVMRVGTLDERDEADFVADTIVRAARGGSRRNECAMLYRTNAQSRAFEDAMRRRGIRTASLAPCASTIGARSATSWRTSSSSPIPSDDEAFRRAVSDAAPRTRRRQRRAARRGRNAREQGIPLLEAATRRAELVAGFAPQPARRFARVRRAHRAVPCQGVDASVDELLRELVDAIRYHDHLRAEGPEGLERIENVRELIAGAAEVVADDGGEVGLTPLDHFLQQATLVAGSDALDPSADAVTMMTMHNAKGLEFPLVFVTGLEDGLFPLARASKLYMTHAESRRRNGEMLRSRPSTFLMDLRPEKLDRVRTVKVRSTGRASIGAFGGGPDSEAWGGRASFGGSEPTALRQGTPVFRRTSIPDYEDISQDQPEFVAGARVKHSRFGDGTIAEVVGSGPAAKVRVDFDDEEIGRKTLIVAQANLQRGDD